MSKEKLGTCDNGACNGKFRHVKQDDCVNWREQPQGEPSLATNEIKNKCAACGNPFGSIIIVRLARRLHPICAAIEDEQAASDVQPEGGDKPSREESTKRALDVCERDFRPSPPAQTSAPYRKVFKRAWHVYRGEDHIALMNCSDDAEQNAELIVTALNALVAQPSAGTAREFYRTDPQWRAAGTAPYTDLELQIIEEKNPSLFLFAEAFAAALAENAQLRQELTRWIQWGVVEVAVRNPQVAEYCKHWEERCERAERALRTVELLIPTMNDEDAKVLRGVLAALKSSEGAVV